MACRGSAVRIRLAPLSFLSHSKKYHLQGCMPDFPRPRDWGCVSCGAAFFKETESVVDCFLEGTAEPFEDMEEVMEKFEVKETSKPPTYY